MKKVAIRLKAIRIGRGLTQKDLALRINKSVSAVSSYESGTQLPPLDVIISIAMELGVTLDYLTGFADNEHFSTRGLTPQQKELIELLYSEFVKSPNDDELSDSKVEIIRKLILLFS